MSGTPVTSSQRRLANPDPLLKTCKRTLQLALSLQYPPEAVITEGEIRMVDRKHALPDFERPGQHGLRFLEPVQLLQGQRDIVETVGQERTVLPIPLLNDRLRFPEGL